MCQLHKVLNKSESKKERKRQKENHKSTRAHNRSIKLWNYQCDMQCNFGLKIILAHFWVTTKCVRKVIDKLGLPSFRNSSGDRNWIFHNFLCKTPLFMIHYHNLVLFSHNLHPWVSSNDTETALLYTIRHIIKLYLKSI